MAGVTPWIIIHMIHTNAFCEFWPVINSPINEQPYHVGSQSRRGEITGNMHPIIANILQAMSRLSHSQYIASSHISLVVISCW